MAEGDTLVNAVIGAVVNVVAGAFLPFGPLFGGAAAGYLEGGSREAGLKVGAIAGVIALVPLFLFLTLFGGLVFAILAGGSMGGGLPMGFPMAAGGFGFVVIVLLLFGAVYIVGLSAVGGYLGNYVKYDTDVDI
ncbi:MAG: DUF5518 domain-containing protein [Haloarculaceae archaeon]